MARPSPTHSGSKELAALGKAIRGLRLETGLSQEALADEAGIDRSYMGGIERGEHNVALINLVKIAKALETTTAELLSKAKL
ncbi:helix-turn-helix domain-containing protein [Polynucleobacter sphagniphilus]|uniref:helix-turn-helix domain-containing protein n=1 Tax=Polynucleobacter sphagniphilus TaxID=1743169 RepID=UPI00240584FB|nr:helix-turn-helix transcriptional regulator [Polynucleobacter sphagniphilus]